MAQSSVKKLVYSTEIIVDNDEIEQALELDRIENEDEEDEEDEKKILGQFKAAIQKIAAKENNLIETYYFNDNWIRYERNQNQLYEDEFILINPRNIEWLHYFTDQESNKKLRKTIYKASDDWEIRYKIEEDILDRKTIVGFDCHKMVIEEFKRNEKEGWTEEAIYTLYVTDEIRLPFYCVELVWEKITEKTALEIKYVNKGLPNTYQIDRAIEYDEKIDDNLLEIPSEYENAIIVE